MPDLTPENVSALLAAGGMRPEDGDDLAEITHRINAIIEAASNLDDAAIDGVQEAANQ